MSTPTPEHPEKEPNPYRDYFEDDELEDEEDHDDSEDCGRWRNGRLSDQCLLAGTEWCDWECPIGCRGAR